VDLDTTYRALDLWLTPGGMMSHQAGLDSHGITSEWNGHWAIPEPLWKVIMGRRPYLQNRQPCSVHVHLLENQGFEIVHLMKKHREDGIDRSRLARKWRGLSDDDLTCSNFYLIARKG
jgi:hypothetical protein